MWTSKNRARYDRSKLRYPSDLTDDEWVLVEPLIAPSKTSGGKRTVIMKEVVNGLMYVLSTGCQWRVIAKDLPPKSTIHGYFDLWTYDGTLQRLYNVDRLNFEWGTFIERGRLSGRSKHQRRRARDVSQFAAGELEPSGCLIEHPRLTSRSIAGGGSDGPAHGSPSARSARLIRGDTTWSPAFDRGVCPSRAADDVSHEGQAEALRCSEPTCEDENQDGGGR
jgi:transposase